MKWDWSGDANEKEARQLRRMIFLIIIEEKVPMRMSTMKWRALSLLLIYFNHRDDDGDDDEVVLEINDNSSGDAEGCREMEMVIMMVILTIFMTTMLLL